MLVFVRSDWLARLTVALALGAPHVGMAADAEHDEDEDSAIGRIVVTATRTATLIGDQPLRVEAVPAEEIEENLTVQPGNLPKRSPRCWRTPARAGQPIWPGSSLSAHARLGPAL